MARNFFEIKGVVQHYSWGGFNFIAQLTGAANNQGQPMAEYWLGAHPNHPAVVKKENTSLAAFLQQHPHLLGKQVVTKFGALPFLFKVLDVRQMLSIQVHPSQAAAAAGFEEENKNGIPPTAPHRNYKDRNHKPELMVALSDFWLLHGFKAPQLLMESLLAVPEFLSLAQLFKTGGYKALFETVMTLPQQQVNAILKPLLLRILPLYNTRQLSKEHPDFWAARAAQDFCTDNAIDRGIFSIYFFNLVHLKPWQGIFQPAGMPHAYLEGQNVEVMANSDNVLRAGLTNKHIDVAELLKHVVFEATLPQIIAPQNSLQNTFTTPATEFELHRLKLLDQELLVETQSAEIWLLLHGGLQVNDGEDLYNLQQGAAAFVPAGALLRLQGKENAELFRVMVPR